MGIFHDLLLEAKAANFEKDLKEAYGMGFRAGRLCPAELRPCEVNGKTALFHAWAPKENVLLKINAIIPRSESERINARYRQDGYVPAGCSTEIIQNAGAIVEWPDGSVTLEPAEKVRFTDREEGRK